MRFIDTHAHLNDVKYDIDLNEVIKRALDVGVLRIIVCGYDMQSSLDAVSLADKYDCVFATIGVHPHDSKSYTGEVCKKLTELSSHKKVAAIGEIGLDFHYDFSPKDDQIVAFKSQIELAQNVSLPIVVHSRESNELTIEILQHNADKISGCVLHCFSGNEDEARQVTDMGFYIGIDGPITFKASEKLRRVVKACPIDKILLETDCPYLSPQPYRGKRNEPAYLEYVAQAVADVKEMSVEEIAEITTANAVRLFGEALFE